MLSVCHLLYEPFSRNEDNKNIYRGQFDSCVEQFEDETAINMR